MKNSNHITFFLFFLISFSNSLFAQFKPAKTYAIYINHPDYTVKTNVLNSNKKVKAKKNLIYYWYSTNKIIETQGGFDGKVLDGPYMAFYLSSNIKERGSFKKGLKTGEWITWFENGRINEIYPWKKDI